MDRKKKEIINLFSPTFLRGGNAAFAFNLFAKEIALEGGEAVVATLLLVVATIIQNWLQKRDRRQNDPEQEGHTLKP